MILKVVAGDITKETSQVVVNSRGAGDDITQGELLEHHGHVLAIYFLCWHMLREINLNFRGTGIKSNIASSRTSLGKRVQTERYCVHINQLFLLVFTLCEILLVY